MGRIPHDKRITMRDDSITIAKAWGIFLMVLAHSFFSVSGEIWIGMFHMPVFFFFAGYCFKTKYLTDFRTFAWNRVRGLMCPLSSGGLYSCCCTMCSFICICMTTLMAWGTLCRTCTGGRKHGISPYRWSRPWPGNEQLLGLVSGF